MAVSHYEAEYDESLRENLVAEFGDDVATAVCETAQLTPPLRHALVQKGREAYHDRTKLLDTLDDEDDQLVAAREQLTDLDTTCQQVEREVVNRPSARLSFSADVFIPPIGGHFTMDRHEDARFAESVDPELVLPVHYDTFEQIETDAEAFEQEIETDERNVQLF